MLEVPVLAHEGVTAALKGHGTSYGIMSIRSMALVSRRVSCYRRTNLTGRCTRRQSRAPIRPALLMSPHSTTALSLSHPQAKLQQQKQQLPLQKGPSAFRSVKSSPSSTSSSYRSAEQAAAADRLIKGRERELRLAEEKLQQKKRQRQEVSLAAWVLCCVFS